VSADCHGVVAKVSAKIGSKASAIKPNRKTSQRSASIRARSRLAGNKFFNRIGHHRPIVVSATIRVVE